MTKDKKKEVTENAPEETAPKSAEVPKGFEMKKETDDKGNVVKVTMKKSK